MWSDWHNFPNWHTKPWPTDAIRRPIWRKQLAILTRFFARPALGPSRCCTSCLPKMIIPYFLSSLCLAAAARHQGRLSALVEDLPPRYSRYGRLKELERLEGFSQELPPKNLTGERLELFEKLQAARSLAWPVLLRQDFTEGLKMFRKLAKEEMIQVRAAAAESPAWPILLEQSFTEGLRLFRTLAEEPQSRVRAQVAQFGPWETLLKQNFGEGLHMFRNLTKDKNEQVRRGAAQSLAWPTVLDQKLEEGSKMFRDLLEDNQSWLVRAGAAQSEPAWPALLKRNLEEGFNMFHELLQDGSWQVRRAAALSSAWPTFLEQNLEEGLNMFRTLADTASLAWRGNVSYAWVHRAREAAEDSPAWHALREPGVAEKLKGLGVQQLLGIAKDLQVIADNGYKIVNSLPLTMSLVNTTRHVTNESLLADLAGCPITLAHRRALAAFGQFDFALNFKPSQASIQAWLSWRQNQHVKPSKLWRTMDSKLTPQPQPLISIRMKHARYDMMIYDAFFSKPRPRRTPANTTQRCHDRVHQTRACAARQHNILVPEPFY